MKKLLTFVGIITVVVLVACGGGSNGNNGGNGGGNNGGNGGGDQTPVTTAQGVYSGSSSGGFAFEAIVLPNDKVYAIYGSNSGGTFVVYGMMAGQGKSSNGSYTASYTDFYYSGSTDSGTISATYVPGSSLSGTYSESGVTASFVANAMPSSSFNYNTAASLSTVAGTWSGTFLDGSSTAITVASNGSFGGSEEGCSYTGTVTPDSSNKNFFDVTVTFGGSPCLLPNQSVTGIAVTYLLSDGVHHQLLVAGTSGSFGTLFMGEQ